MAEHFTLTVDHNGKQQFFEGELRQLGYTHKLFINVNGLEVVFEPDEERNYRVIIQEEIKVDKPLIQKILAALENDLK